MRRRPAGGARAAAAHEAALAAGRRVGADGRVEERRPLATSLAAAAARPREREVLACAGARDVEQPALLLEAGRGVGVLDREGAGDQADDEHRVPLEPLRGVDGRERDAVGGRCRLGGRADVEVGDEVAQGRGRVVAREVVGQRDEAQQVLPAVAHGPRAARRLGRPVHRRQHRAHGLAELARPAPRCGPRHGSG